MMHTRLSGHCSTSANSVCLPRSTYLLVDPCEREERVMDGLLMIAMNKHREICSIQSSGGIMLLKEQVNATGDPGSFLCKTSLRYARKLLSFGSPRRLDHMLPFAFKVMRCSKIASVKVSEITDLVSKALENDKTAR